MKNVKFSTLMKQAKEGTIEIESWPICQMAYGVAWIRKANGIRESVRINDVPAEFAKQHNAQVSTATTNACPFVGYVDGMAEYEF